MNTGDTIAAISSAAGAASRMIVRASGAAASMLVRRVAASDFVPGSNRARLLFNGCSVPAWLYCFAGPRSATGEDVAEFHIPGNPLLARWLLDELIRLGARQAEPGEFTARAYFNGRLTLAQAEGVAASIAAHSARELAAARQLLAGELSRRLEPAMELAAQTLALVEAGIDFTDQDVSFLSDDALRRRLQQIDELLEQLVAGSARFERLSHEPHIVLAGRPNAGKSTLLNTLAGHERAVVSSQAGTTRDAIWASVQLRRGTVRIIDVAGFDEHAADSIALQMQQRTAAAISQADLIVSVRAADDPRGPAGGVAASLNLMSKSDLGGQPRPNEIPVSAQTGANLPLLRDQLDALAFGASTAGDALALNARHLRAIGDARDALARARRLIGDAGPEMLALELRDTLDALGRVLGTITPDELLGRIFSTFCIGK